MMSGLGIVRTTTAAFFRASSSFRASPAAVVRIIPVWPAARDVYVVYRIIVDVSVQ